jgi:hypothetical protein
MPDVETNDTPTPATNWTIDVQRGLAWAIILSFITVIMILAIRVAIWSLPNDSLELLKQVQNALINVVMVVIGYFFGSSKSSQSKDDTINKIAMAPPASPVMVAPLAPIAPIAPVAPVAPIAPVAPVSPVVIVETPPGTTVTEKGP